MNDIILIYPGRNWVGSTGLNYPPNSLITIGGVLEKNGFKPNIVDARFEDYRKVDYDGALFVGISAMSGRQIKHGLEISKFIKARHPNVPIVWGGVHPTILPEQTLQNENVDIVVRGEGELTALELAQRLEKGAPLDGVKGLSFKREGRIITNENRPFMNLDTAEDLAYHLLKDPKLYTPTETFHYASSRGCPHRCAFCYNASFCKNTWRSKSIGKIMEDIRTIIDRYHPKCIDFLEDNFFVSRERVEQIADFLIKEGINVTWTGDIRANYFDQYDRGFLQKIKRSGCKEVILGAESGSPGILKAVQKDITVEQIEKSIKMCKESDINLVLLFVIGFPYETKQDLCMTIDLISRIFNEYGVHSTISIFSPYPGTPLFETAKEYGFTPPTSLEDWGNWNFSNVANAPWLDSETRDFIEAAANSSRLMSKKVLSFSASPVIMAKNLTRAVFTYSANVRWEHKYFKHPFEWRIWTRIQKWRGYA